MKPLQTILLIFLTTHLLGQNVILYTNKRSANSLFENSYRFFVPDIPCSSIIFKCDNGKIAQNGCALYYRPDTAINTIFKVYKKVKTQLQLIDSIKIEVRDFREAGAWLAGKSGGFISREEALSMGGIIAKMYVTEGHSEPIKVLSYKVITISGDTVQLATNVGNLYSDKAVSLISKLQTNDKLIFADIKAKDFFNKEISLNAMEFSIK